MTALGAFRWWYLLFFVAGLVLLGSFYFDADVQLWIAQHQDDNAKTFMRNVSRFGDWPEHLALGLILPGIAFLTKNKKWMRIFLAMLVALAIAGAAARVIKIGAGRARPSVTSSENWSGPRFTSKFHAFPSGHTAASIAFFATLAFASWRTGLALLPIPMLIAFSRMYVAAHYLSDVVGAALLGILTAYFVARWSRLRSFG